MCHLLCGTLGRLDEDTAVIAIVFWSARNSNCSEGQYQAALSGFHLELNRDKPAGFRRSVSFRVESDLPWISANTHVFEDWYLVSNFSAIDALDLAISDTRRFPSHVALMKYTGRACGSIVGLDKGTAIVERNHFAYWFARPRGVSADDVAELAARKTTSRAISAWTRALALGPMGSCLLVDQAISLPAAFGAREVIRSVFWSPSDHKPVSGRAP